MNLAIIKTGGKQYKVKTGDKIRIEKLNGPVGENITLDTLLISDSEEKNLEIGKPLLSKKVEAKILSHGRADKVHIIKFKSKVRYRRKAGHRQHYTLVEIIKT